MEYQDIEICNVSESEKKRLVEHFNTLLEQVIRDNNLMSYNDSTNDFNEVYKLIANYINEILIPTNLRDINQLYEYNVLQSNHTQEKLTLAYIKKHFDKLTK